MFTFINASTNALLPIALSNQTFLTQQRNITYLFNKTSSILPDLRANLTSIKNTYNVTLSNKQNKTLNENFTVFYELDFSIPN